MRNSNVVSESGFLYAHEISGLVRAEHFKTGDYDEHGISIFDDENYNNLIGKFTILPYDEVPIYVKFDPPFDNESYDQMYYTIYSLWNRIAEGTGATQYVNDNTKVFIELPDSSIDYTGYRVLFKNDLTPYTITDYDQTNKSASFDPIKVFYTICLLYTSDAADE